MCISAYLSAITKGCNTKYKPYYFRKSPQFRMPAMAVGLVSHDLLNTITRIWMDFALSGRTAANRGTHVNIYITLSIGPNTNRDHIATGRANQVLIRWTTFARRAPLGNSNTGRALTPYAKREPRRSRRQTRRLIAQTRHPDMQHTLARKTRCTTSVARICQSA